MSSEKEEENQTHSKKFKICPYPIKPFANFEGPNDFTAETKNDSMKETTFHIFMNKLMSDDVTIEQLKQKVLALKKYETGDNFTKPCSERVFKLFNKVWGKNGSKETEINGNGNEKIVKCVKMEATINNEKIIKHVKKELPLTMVVLSKRN